MCAGLSLSPPQVEVRFVQDDSRLGRPAGNRRSKVTQDSSVTPGSGSVSGSCDDGKLSWKRRTASDEGREGGEDIWTGLHVDPETNGGAQDPHAPRGGAGGAVLCGSGESRCGEGENVETKRLLQPDLQGKSGGSHEFKLQIRL